MHWVPEQTRNANRITASLALLKSIDCCFRCPSSHLIYHRFFEDSQRTSECSCRFVIIAISLGCTHRKYNLACCIRCHGCALMRVFWFRLVWSVVASRRQTPGRVIRMTACEITGSASFAKSLEGYFSSPEFCIAEFDTDATGVAGVTPCGLLVSIHGS